MGENSLQGEASLIFVVAIVVHALAFLLALNLS